MLALNSADEGQFVGQFPTTVPGIYRFRVRVRGTTRRGEPFTREQTLTAAVWRGGDQPPNIDHLPSRDERLCELINCLLVRDGAITPQLQEHLRKLGIDPAAALKCLEQFCRDVQRPR
jgi:hypothetical protein